MAVNNILTLLVRRASGYIS